MDPAKAFWMTNFMFVIALVAYLIWGSHQDSGFRALLSSLFMLSGTSFYIWWSHPEVMTASLMALGLVAWLDRRLVFASACFAVASTQNPPVALILVLPWLSLGTGLLRMLRNGRQLRGHVVTLIALSIVSLIVFVPNIWYLWRIGVANPIVAAGAANFGLENFTKSLDLFFDLNQGMVLVHFTTLAFLSVWVTKNLVSLPTATARERARLGWVTALLVLSATMAVLAASSQNWNPGITVISRYSYWLSMPVIFAACLAVEGITYKRLRYRIEFALVFSALASIGLFGLDGKSASYVAFTPPSRVAMQMFPNWYFPHPEVFCERAQSSEGCSFERAYVYARNDRRLIKVLVAEDHVLRICGAPAREAPARRETYQGKSLLWFSSDVTCPSGDSVLRKEMLQSSTQERH
jgi:hypothetical protein